MHALMTFEKDDPSPFIDPIAVEVWDTWFRWRDGGQLRDISIEATWERVARALACSDPTPSPRWINRVIDAQAHWQIVFDERILAGAGTPHFAWPHDPVAVLNLSSFVNAPLSADACFDFESMRAAADLAVESLDNALLCADRDNAFADLRVGVIGLADALALLGKRYDGPAGRVLAGRMAQTLAEGALRANVRLAGSRGARVDRCDATVERLRSRAMPADLVEMADRSGLRHACVTAITSHPRLATLANDVTDALDPLESGECLRLSACVAALRAKRSGGFVQSIVRRLGMPREFSPRAVDDRHTCSLAAQMALRGAVQPWIDAPIACPFRVEHAPDALATIRWKQLAAANRLGDLTLAVIS